MNLFFFFMSTRNYGRGEPSGYGFEFRTEVPEGPGSIPDVAKDPPSACGVRARKICDSECPVGVVSRKKFPPFSETYQNCGRGDGWWCCYLS